VIAYLEKYDTTVDVPDDASDKDVKDINDNFHSYVDTAPASGPATPAKASQPEPATEGQPKLPEGEVAPPPKWQPNFYESVMSDLMKPVQVGKELLNPESPEAQAFAGKAAEQLSFGAAKPLLEPIIGQEAKDHPAFAGAGEMAGGVGSLLEAGGALRIAGLGTAAAAAGEAAEPVWAAGSRFIPRAIMTGATFGTRTFIAETVKAFEDHGVNLEQFGKDVLKDTAFGATFGAIGGMEKPIASISSAGALGFLSSKMQGADNREAALNAAIWGAFETVGSVGKSEALRMEALNNLKGSMSEYAQARGGIPPEQADQAAGMFLDKAMAKAGFKDAASIAKSGPENLLEGLEKVNQMVRNAQIPHPGAEPGEPLPKLPAPIAPEAPAEAQAPETPKGPIDKAIDTVKQVLGLKTEEPALEGQVISSKEMPAHLKPGSGDWVATNLQQMAKDYPGVLHQDPKTVAANMSAINGVKVDPDEVRAQQILLGQKAKDNTETINKSMADIADRLTIHGLKEPEKEAIFNHYAENLPEMIRKPIEEQYQDAYKTLAAQRGIPAGKPDAATMDQAEKAVDLINAHFNPKSQEIKDFTAAHGEASDHDIAQMAYNRGMLESPNPDLLKAEIEKAKQEKIPTHPLSSESGAVMVPPDLEDAAMHMRESAKEISHLVSPDKAAPLAYRIHRAEMGKKAQAYDRAEMALKDSMDFFDKQPAEFTRDFVDRWEAGQPQANPNLDAMMNLGKQILNDKWKQYEEVIGKTKPQIKNYFPHDWEQSDEQVSKAVENAAKRPWAGKQAFRKERTIPDVKTGREIGLKERELNPMRAVLNKALEMDKFITAHQTLKQLKEEGLAKFFRVGEKPFDGWQKIDDRISTVAFRGEQGLTIAGHIYAQPDAARIINNYLSKGMEGSQWFRDYRFVANAMVRARLSISAFHAGFMGMNAFNNTAALALNQLMTGHPINAMVELKNFPVAPIRELIMGNKLRQAWFGKGGSDFYEQIATLAAESGARARMDPFWAMEASKNMKQFFKTGRIVQGVISLPFSILEQLTKPLMEHMVPLQKFGAWSQIIKMEMDNNPTLSHTELVKIGQRAWDSVDNRMGQFVTDNLAWNKTFKQLTMASFQSLTWHLGEFREAGGGVKESALLLKEILSGKRPKAYYKLSYTMVYPVVIGMFGAMLMKLMTGKNAQTIKDLYYPQTGGVDENGNPHRSALPSYMKDYFHLIDNPVQAATNWLNPLPQSLVQMLENKDYNGVKIRNEDDPLVRQVAGEVMHVIKQWEPYSIENMQKNHQTGNKTLLDTVGPWVGVTPAGYDINQTKAERVAHDIEMSHQEIGGRTEEQFQRSRLIGELSRQYKMGVQGAQENIQAAHDKGLISETQMRNIYDDSNYTVLQNMVRHGGGHGMAMSLEETKRVFAHATPEEKGQLQQMLDKKQIRHDYEFTTP
jgi:hypothetical protein